MCRQLTMVDDHGTLDFMETVSISKFKATCLARLDKVKRTGRPILITRRGVAIAEVNPPSPPKASAGWLGSLASTGRIVGDIVSPAAADDWEALS
jgi:antitoxin (DNA-binding transcriptional repressor) of toxin-antitoxin stability system